MSQQQGMTKPGFIILYKKSVIYEQAVLTDISTTLQRLRNQNLQPIKHQLLEGDRLAEEERQYEFSRVQKHLAKLQLQVDELNKILEKNETANLRSLLLITQNNLSEAKLGWEQANSALEERYQSLTKDIETSRQLYQQLVNTKVAPRAPVYEGPARLNSNKYNQNTPQYLQLIEDELRHINAPYGGWSAEDHERYWLRFIYSSKMNRRLFINKIAIEFPTFTLNALQRHDDFCMQLQKLTYYKKEFLAKMKQNREEMRRQDNLKASPAAPVFKTAVKKMSGGDLEKIRALRERRQMAKEDRYSRGLQQRSLRERELRAARERAHALRQKRAFYEEVKRQQKRQSEELARQQQELSAEQRLELQKKMEQLRQRQQADMQAVHAKYDRIVQMRQRGEQRERQLEQLAALCRPEVDRDAGAVFKPTKAQYLRLDEITRARKEGERLGSVTVGFDPFAVIPIGGLQKATWM